MKYVLFYLFNVGKDLKNHESNIKNKYKYLTKITEIRKMSYYFLNTIYAYLKYNKQRKKTSNYKNSKNKINLKKIIEL